MNFPKIEFIERIDKLHFNNMKKSKTIIISAHALNHLSTTQRKLFKEEELIKIIDKQTPIKIYLQSNGRYCVYYRLKKHYQKIILQFYEKKIVIVTFMNITNMPSKDD